MWGQVGRRRGARTPACRVHNRFRDLDERWKSASTGRRNQTACPTFQQGGAGGFACRSNGHNQWSASKMNNKPLPHTQLQSKSYAVERSVRLLTASPGSAAENLLFDEFLLSQREEALRFWECSRPVVVLGHGGRLKEQVRIDACAADGVEVLRRGSGGGAVVLGPGCLNYSLIFSLEAHPAWRDVRRS